MGRGKLSGRVQDPSRQWQARVGKLADMLGWERDELFVLWSQVAFAIELDTRIEHRVRLERSLAERAAYYLVETCITKQEGEPS